MKASHFKDRVFDIRTLLLASLLTIWIFTGLIILNLLKIVSYSQIRMYIIMLTFIGVFLYWIYLYSKKQKLINEYVEESRETKILAIFGIISVFISGIIVFYAIFIRP